MVSRNGLTSQTTQRRWFPIPHKSLFLTTAALVAVFALTGPAGALKFNQQIDFCLGQEVTAKSVERFSAKTWRLIAWERGKPPSRHVGEAHRRHVRCAAGPGHRRAIRHRWREDKRLYFEHRQSLLERERWEPYVCGGRHYALPCAVTECESGYYFGHHSGAYGILDSTWAYWGGGRFAPYPGAATPREQAIIARRVWEAVGPGAWECPL